MARLINDTGLLNKKLPETGKGINEAIQAAGGFALITEAIHQVQTEMGITGTTAKEASTTIQGSVSSMKGAWENLLVSFSTGNISVYESIDKFVESVETVATNVLPVVEKSLKGVNSLVVGLVPEIMAKIPTYIQEYLPMLLETITTIIGSLSTALTENQDVIFDTILQVITSIVNLITTQLPAIIELGFNLIIALAMGIAENLDTLMPSIMEAILKIVEVLTNPENLSKLLEAALTLITELAFGLMEAIPQLVEAAYQIINGVVRFLIAPENINMLVSAAVQIIFALLSGLVSQYPVVIESIATLIKDIIDDFKNTDWAEIGQDVIDGVLSGLKKAWENVKKWFTDAWSNLVGDSKKELEIHSPSKVFGRIGRDMALGVGVGWNDNFPEDDIVDSLAFDDADYGYQTATTTTIERDGTGGNAYNSQKVDVTIGIEDSGNALGLARALLPFLKIAEKEVYA